MVIYDSADIFVDEATDLRGRIDRLRLVIDALESSALKAASGGDITEYQLDDGQSKIKTTKGDSASIARSILAFEKILQMNVNKLNGRAIRLVDSRSTKRYY